MGQTNLILESLLVWAMAHFGDIEAGIRCIIAETQQLPYQLIGTKSGPTQKCMGASPGMPQARQLTGQEHGPNPSADRLPKV